MFNDENYGDSLEDYNKKRDKWVEKMSKQLLNAVSTTLNDESLVRDFTLALSWYYYNCTTDEEITFFNKFGLSYNHSLCYLHYDTNKYEEEIEAAYQEELHEDAY